MELLSHSAISFLLVSLTQTLSSAQTTQSVQQYRK